MKIHGSDSELSLTRLLLRGPSFVLKAHKGFMLSVSSGSFLLPSCSDEETFTGKI